MGVYPDGLMVEEAMDVANSQPDGSSGYGSSSDGGIRFNFQFPSYFDASHTTRNASTALPLPGLPSIAASRASSVSATAPQSVQLRPMPMRIDAKTERRANDVIERLSELLVEYMSKHRKKASPMAIRLATLGKSEDDVKAYLVVVCGNEKGNHRRVWRFLRKDRARELYQPKDMTLPCFQVNVVGPPPRRQMGAHVDIPLYEHLFDESQVTRCGMSIYFVRDDGLQRTLATVGGILQLHHDGGDYLFGLTAAHAMDPNGEDVDYDTAMVPDDEDNEGDSLSLGSDDDDDSSSESTASSHGQHVGSIKIDWEPWLQSESQKTERDEQLPVRQTATEAIALSAFDDAHNGVFRDWALFLFPSEILPPKPNMLLFEGKRPIPLNLPKSSDHLHGTRDVAIITSLREPLRGTLSPCLGRILLPPGKTFVRAYTIELRYPTGNEHFLRHCV